MDTPNDDNLLGPDDGGNPIDDTTANYPLGPENTFEDVEHLDVPTDAPKGVELPTPEEILQRLNNELNSKHTHIMEEKTPPVETPTPEKMSHPDKGGKKAKKSDEATVTIKKDYTVLFLSIAVLLITVGIYAWQNYRKKKEDENTVDLAEQQQEGYEQENYYPQ